MIETGIRLSIDSSGAIQCAKQFADATNSISSTSDRVGGSGKKAFTGLVSDQQKATRQPLHAVSGADGGDAAAEPADRTSCRAAANKRPSTALRTAFGARWEKLRHTWQSRSNHLTYNLTRLTPDERDLKFNKEFNKQSSCSKSLRPNTHAHADSELSKLLMFPIISNTL